MSGTRVFEARPIDVVEVRGGGTLRDLLSVLFKRRRMIVLFFLGAMITVTLANFMLAKTEYMATTQILLSPDRDQVANLTLAPTSVQAQRYIFNAEEQTARMLEMFGGRYLAERVVESIGPTVLYDDLQAGPVWALGLLKKPTNDPQVLLDRAVARFTQNVFAEPAGKSLLINLSFKHQDPVIAAKAANLLATAYLDRQLGLQKNPKTNTFFQEQFQILKQKLKASEERLELLKQSNGITSSVKDEIELIVKQQVALRTGLNEATSLRAEVSNRMAQLRAQLANTSRTPGAINILRNKLTSLEVQENELALRVTSEHPTLRGLREEIRQLKEKIAHQEESKSYGTVSAGDSNLFGTLQQELLRNEAEEHALRARQEAQNIKLAEFQKRLETLDRIAPEFGHLQQEVQVDEQNYRLYLTKFEESRISSAMDVEKIASARVIEPAEPPRTPLSSKSILRLALGLIFGGLGGIAIAFLLQLTSGRLESIHDVERFLELPVLASIPELETK